jgi:ribosomal protein S18 acetylase RimI-like enzyme
MEARVATPADVPTVVATITAAFHDDPTWSWAFPDPERRPAQYTEFWSLFVESAVPNGGVWLTEGSAAVAVWVPPGCSELSEEAEARLEPLLQELVSSHAAAVLEVFERFDAAHPHDEPHYYLSLLGAHPDHQGKGVGLGLLAENLDRIDGERMPAYLEASNPANVALYERFGFTKVGEFSCPGGGPTVATMWRDAR